MAKKTNTKVNGQDYYRIRRKVGEDAEGKAIMKAFYGDGKKEAEAKYLQYMKDLESAPNKNRNDSLGKVAKFYTYQVLLNENLAVTTIDLYERQYRTKLAPSKLATRPIKDVTSGDIQKFLNEIARGTLDGKAIKVTQGAMKALVKYLKRLFRYLEIEGYCRNPMPNVSVPQLSLPEDPQKVQRKKSDTIEVFSEAEIKKIISTPNRLSFFFQLAFATGLREGELLALRYDDFQDGNLHVDRQIVFTRTIQPDGGRIRQGIIKAPKSASSVRTVPVPENVQQAFKKHTQWHRQEMMQNGYRTNYVFTTESGHLIDGSNFRRAWSRHLNRIGISYKKFHACRATYCTTLCRRGVPLETASKLMGHSNINVTAAYYRFIGATEMINAADRINDLFYIKN